MKKKTLHPMVLLPLLMLNLSGCGLEKEYNHFVSNFWHKFNELVNADRENFEMREEVLQLKSENLSLKKEIAEYEEKEKAQRLRALALKEGGNENARVLRGLIPEAFEQGRHPSSIISAGTEILSVQGQEVYNLSFENFKNAQFDKAARGFLALLNGKEKNKYNNYEVNYFLGISFYKLKNYKNALASFEQSLKQTEKLTQGIVFVPKILLWKSMSLHKLGHNFESRRIAQKIIEEYPDSNEARRVR